MATQARAKVGGEIGANGEWYEGGKFLNTVKENAKKDGSHVKVAKVRNVEIEPGVWVMQPSANAKPLISFIGRGAEPCRNGSDFRMTPRMAAFANDGTCGGVTLAEMQAICNRYNAGERWL